MALSTLDSAYVRALLLSEAAIVISETKGYLIEGRLTPIARQVGASSVADLVTSLRGAPRTDTKLRDLVVDALTTNETSWFRDRHPFEALRLHVLPSLIEARKSTRSLTVWCGAASTGQEPYSVAILIREHFPLLAGWNIRFIATDISRASLRQAREGLYGQLEINRGLPAALISRYFKREGTRFLLDQRIRNMIEFRELNLIGPWTGVPRSDLVFLRNVLIYFDPPTKTKILDRIATEVLRSDAALFLGGAETTLNLTTRYQRVQRGPCAWYLPGGASR